MSGLTLRRISIFQYGLLALPLAFAGLPIYVHAPDFYASKLGVSLTGIGIGLLIIRVIDAVQDPLIGYLSDRHEAFRQRILLLGSLLLGGGFWMLFHPIDNYLLPWFLLSVLICTTGFSIVSINLQALGGLWVASYHERTRITGVREGLGLVGLLVASSIPTLLQRNVSFADSFHYLSLIFLPLLVLGLISCISWLKSVELSSSARSGKQEFALMRLLRRDLWSSSFFLLFFLSNFASAIPAVLVLFFIRDRLGAETHAGLFLVLYFISGALAMPLWQQLSKRSSKAGAWFASMVLACATFVWAFMLGEGDITAYAVICVLSGLALGADLAIPPSIIADRIEEKQDEKTASQYFSAMTFFAKTALALATGLALPMLAWLGYEPGGANHSESLLYLAVFYALIPCGLKLLSAAFLAFKFLNIKQHFTLKNKGVCIMCSFLFFGGCSGIAPQQYLDQKPSFDIKEYFNGNIKAWGIIQDRSGNIVSRFDIAMHGEWEGDRGTLKEDFTYYDGSTQQRIWRLKKVGENKFEGRADDIIGVADGGTFGNATRWNYVMDVPVGDSKYRIRFDDWMWLMNDGVLMNRSYMKKFGLTVAEITVFMKKAD
jgi:Na+/melibiose symporter-like transporter